MAVQSYNDMIKKHLIYANIVLVNKCFEISCKNYLYLLHFPVLLLMGQK